MRRRVIAYLPELRELYRRLYFESTGVAALVISRPPASRRPSASGEGDHAR